MNVISTFCDGCGKEFGFHDNINVVGCRHCCDMGRTPREACPDRHYCDKCFNTGDKNFTCEEE